MVTILLSLGALVPAVFGLAGLLNADHGNRGGL